MLVFPSIVSPNEFFTTDPHQPLHFAFEKIQRSLPGQEGHAFRTFEIVIRFDWMPWCYGDCSVRNNHTTGWKPPAVGRMLVRTTEA